MKNVLKMILVSSLLVSSVVLANQQMTVDKKAYFAPHAWTSNNSKDVKVVQYGDIDSFVYNVNLSVNLDYSAGINVKNCGNVAHLNPGDSAICELTQSNPIISFSSDKEDAPASGTTAIEKA